MTDDIWNTNSRIDEMLRHLGAHASRRKLRLFAVACARQVLPRLSDRGMMDALDVAERFADEELSKNRLVAARKSLQLAHAARTKRWPRLYSSHIRSVPAWHATRDQIVPGAMDCAGCCAWSTTRKKNGTMTIPEKEFKRQAKLLRDIFGNPFRPMTIDPRWLSATVRDLATSIYSDRAFERMPILGDALMDAGCNNDDIITHCQGPGPHVRGCWLVDLILGKS